MINGILLVDKPSGPTSHDIVDIVRKWSGQRRVGHTGTLDPMATGLLVLLLGKATRLSQWMTGYDKEYAGTAVFGIATDTLDSQGRVTERSPAPWINEGGLKRAAADMLGRLRQTPPEYSAVKTNGVPSYVMARKGAAPLLKAREVTIGRLEIELLEPGDFPRVGFTVLCSSGTYVRQLFADIGRSLNAPCHLTGLRRTAVGEFTLDRALTIYELEKSGPGTMDTVLIPMSDGLVMPEVVAAEGSGVRLVSGQVLDMSDLDIEGEVCEGYVKIIDQKKRTLLAIGEIIDKRIRPVCVLTDSRDLLI